jgi:hypothetical protein
LLWDIISFKKCNKEFVMTERPLIDLPNFTGSIEPQSLFRAFTCEEDSNGHVFFGQPPGTRMLLTRDAPPKRAGAVIAQRLGLRPEESWRLEGWSLTRTETGDLVKPHERRIGFLFEDFTGEPWDEPTSYRLVAEGGYSKKSMVHILRHPRDDHFRQIHDDVTACLNEAELESIIAPDEKGNQSYLVYSHTRLGEEHGFPENGEVDTVYYWDRAVGEFRLKACWANKYKNHREGYSPASGDTTLAIEPLGKFTLRGDISEAGMVANVLFPPQSRIIDHKTRKLLRYGRIDNYFGIEAAEGQWEAEEINNW